MSLITSLLTGGSNSHEETSETANGVATDFVSEGVVGAITATSGVAPMTGGYAVNAQGTPDMTVAVSAGVAYVTATPSSQNSQTLRVRNTASANVTISANSSGSTKYDWLYLSVSAANAANPNAAGDNVTTLTTSRSSSSASDDGTPPTYGTILAVVTVANGASSITNGNISDRRAVTGSQPADGTVTARTISTSAILLGFASVTSITGTASTSVVQITGLTATVTVPDGGRSVKVTVEVGDVRNATDNSIQFLSLWNGTVGSGTQLQEKQCTMGGASRRADNSFVFIHTPAAGSITYNVGHHVSAGTSAYSRAATAPGQLIVEVI